MFHRVIFILFSLSLAGMLWGCPGNYGGSIPDTHPANPQAQPAPSPQPSEVLAIHSPAPDPMPPEMKKEKKGMMHP
jgi:hypothetical protein